MIFIDLNTQNILVPFMYLLYNEDPTFVSSPSHSLMQLSTAHQSSLPSQPGMLSSSVAPSNMNTRQIGATMSGHPSMI